jgi:hypothetical protein
MTQVFRHGLDELKRRWHRRQLKKQLAGHDATRATLLGQLGQRGFEDGIDLSPHAALRDAIGQLNERAGGIAAKSRTLDADLAALQERRRAADAPSLTSSGALQKKSSEYHRVAWSARNRASPFLVPGRRPSSASPKGSSS